MTASSLSIFQADQTAKKFSTTSTDLIVQVVEISVGLRVTGTYTNTYRTRMPPAGRRRPGVSDRSQIMSTT